MEPREEARRSRRRWDPLIGMAVVVFFVGGFGASSVPAGTAADKDWEAAYANHGQQVHHLVTGFCFVFAGLCLTSFLTALWTTVAAARRPEMLARLPLVAARVSGASIAVGGLLMGGMSGAMLIGAARAPGAHVLRSGNGLGFVMVSGPGMLAAGLSVAYLSVQARSVGLFGKKLMVFGLVVAVVLLGAVVIVPIVALLVWLIVVAIVLMQKMLRRHETRADPLCRPEPSARGDRPLP